MFNSCLLFGRLTQDPELKTTDNNKKYCNFTLAVERSYKNKDGQYDVDFINITVWDAKAEQLCKYAKKGNPLTVKGSLETYKDENNKTRLVVKPDRFMFLEKQKNKDDMGER